MADSVLVGEEYDIAIRQGTKDEEDFLYEEENGTPISLVGKKARMQIRTKVGGEVLMTYTSEAVSPNPRLVMREGGVVNSIKRRAGATKTALLTRGGVYDLEIYTDGDPNDAEALMAGKVILEKQVTILNEV